MYQLKSLEDTIVAISTPAGQGGIGIVRLSGKAAVAVADRMFVTRKGDRPSQFASHTARYGDVVRPDTREVIDEALLTVMRSPKSYTKEDIVEISCHGGPASMRLILRLATECGARLAEPGEFTKRAFLNGRIDLAQAEAVLDVIQAKTESFLRVSTNQLKGDLSTELEHIRTQLTDIYVEIEAAVNFPEDEVEEGTAASPRDRIASNQERVEQLIASGEHGRILKEGITIALCGKTNVGKSSLLNVMLKNPRAIVSSTAGTTRDTIEETAQIGGIPFKVVDTAGFLKPRDGIEEEAVDRSRRAVACADLVIFLFDAARDLDKDDRDLMAAVNGRHVLAVLNKCDLPQKIDERQINVGTRRGSTRFACSPPSPEQTTNEMRSAPKGAVPLLKISALKRTGIDRLEECIVESVWHNGNGRPQEPLLSNIRHINALKDCQASLEQAVTGLEGDLFLEFVSEEIKRAVNCLDQITGRNIDADLLDTIFSRFCIGK